MSPVDNMQHYPQIAQNAIYAPAADPPPPPDKKAKKKTKTSSACKECKRLKLKCDKKFPCHSCVKRGCSSICPDGVLVTGKGSRFVLSGSEQLHERIDVLTERVRELEEALDHVHSETKPNERHPMLSEELLQIKSTAEWVNGPRRGLNSKMAVNPLIAADQDDDESEDEAPGEQRGMLKIDDSGTSTYFGSTARTEYFLLGPDDLGLPDNPTPIEILLASSSFPFTTLAGTQDDITVKIHSSLPPMFDSERLCEIYHARVSWMYDPLPDSERYLEELRDEMYHGAKIDLHKLSVLFMIHALAHFLDLDRDPYSAEAFHCFELAKACLAIRSVLDHPTIASIQSMFLMCYFLLLGNKKPDAGWTIMGIIVKVAQSIGLHRDDFQLTEDEQQERRTLWWEVATLEGWMALGFGRPPAVRLLNVNAKQPKYLPSTIDAGFRGWMHLFGRTALPPILEVTLGAKTALYNATIQAEDKVKKSHVPPMLEVTRTAGGDTPIALTFQRAMVVTARALTTLKLHLGWFTLAITENPANLKKSKYHQSVEAVHHSACTLIASLHHLTVEDFPMACRFGLFWSNTLSSAVPLCLIVTRSPSSDLAGHCLREVELCYNMFARGSGAGCHMARVSLPALQRFRDKARNSLLEHMGGMSLPAIPNELDDPDTQELARLGGKTQLVRGNSRDALSSFSINEESSSRPSVNQFQSQSQLSSYSMPPPPPPLVRNPSVHTESSHSFRPPMQTQISDVRTSSSSATNPGINISISHNAPAQLPPLQQLSYQSRQYMQHEPTHQVPQNQPQSRYTESSYQSPQSHTPQHQESQYQGYRNPVVAPSPVSSYIYSATQAASGSSHDFRYIPDSSQTPRPQTGVPMSPDESPTTMSNAPIRLPPPQPQYPAHYPSQYSSQSQNIPHHEPLPVASNSQSQQLPQPTPSHLWPLQFPEQSVYPPYNQGTSSQQQGDEAMDDYYYEQHQQPDYLSTPQSSENPMFRRQQDLYNNMVRDLHSPIQ